MQNKNVGIFGGSFDPPHLGHVVTVASVLMTEPKFDLILIVPCFSHAEKKSSLSVFYHRYEMVNSAFKYLNKVQVSDVEAQLEGVSYTSETVKFLAEQHEDWKLHVILGADLKERVKNWERWDEAQKYAAPYWIGRAGFGTENIFSPPCSSTMIRELIAQNKLEEASRFLPKEVLNYIQLHTLYR